MEASGKLSLRSASVVSGEAWSLQIGAQDGVYFANGSVTNLTVGIDEPNIWRSGIYIKTIGFEYSTPLMNDLSFLCFCLFTFDQR
jgi:hypothetical protein